MNQSKFVNHVGKSLEYQISNHLKMRLIKKTKKTRQKTIDSDFVFKAVTLTSEKNKVMDQFSKKNSE